MALQTQYTMTNGLTANNAYIVIMIPQRNKVDNRIEAEVHVYVDKTHRLSTSELNPPLHRFLHVIDGEELADFEPNVLASEGISLETAIYNHIKANVSEYEQAVDV